MSDPPKDLEGRRMNLGHILYGTGAIVSTTLTGTALVQEKYLIAAFMAITTALFFPVLKWGVPEK